MATYAPAWLQVSDVKDWLRLNEQDTSDDDLLARVCAMAEPYVIRCRPEWQAQAVAPQLLLPVIPGDANTPTTLDVANTTPDNEIPLAGVWLDPAAVWALPDASPAWLLLTGAAAPQAVQALWSTPQGAMGLLSQGGLRALAAAHARITISWDGAAEYATLTQLPGTLYLPDAETYQGAVMYAAREYRRRNSPAGIELFGDVTSFVTRFDPDIDRALQTGSWARPVVS